MNKFNLIKSSFILGLVFCVSTAFAITPYEGIYKAPMDKTFNDFSFKVYKPIYKISDKTQQEKVFQIADYFSNNYPFSKTQIEQYFDDTFVTKESENNGHFIANIFEPSKPNINLKDVDFRDASLKQLLVLTFKQPICFARDDFDKAMDKQNFELVFEPSNLYFSGKMAKAQGRMSFSLADTNDRILRCVNTLVFDTFEQD